MSEPLVTNRKRGNRFKVHWSEERIIEAIRAWSDEHGEPPRRTDWDPKRCELLAQAAWEKADEWRKRAHLFRVGEWPSPRTVTEVFGSWNSAIEAAGLTPRLPSQRTARGVTPSHFLAPLGHVVGLVYDAEDGGDTETLRTTLLQLARVAQELADQLIGDEESLAQALGEEATPGGKPTRP